MAEITKTVALQMHISQEHKMRIFGSKNKLVNEACEGREQEVASIIFQTAHVVSEIEEEDAMPLANMFLLGYVMRGYDNLLDFDLTAEEFRQSFMKTHVMELFANLFSRDMIADMIKKIAGEEASDD